MNAICRAGVFSAIMFATALAGYLEASELLDNRSFEDVHSLGSGLWHPSVWWGDASTSAVTEPVRSGNYALKMAGVGQLQGAAEQFFYESTTGMDYDGKQFKASIYAYMPTEELIFTTKFKCAMSLTFEMDGGAYQSESITLIDAENFSTPLDSWIYGEITATAPVDTIGIHLTIGWHSFDENDYPWFNPQITTPRAVYLDDASLTIVPEPASVMLFALTAAAVMRRRVA